MLIVSKTLKPASRHILIILQINIRNCNCLVCIISYLNTKVAFRQMYGKSIMLANRKSHVLWLVLKSATLDDLEWPLYTTLYLSPTYMYKYQ